MAKVSPKQYNAAVKADLIARQYVLNEKLNHHERWEDLLSIFRELDIISHHMECLKVRSDFKGSEGEKMKTKILRASKEKRIIHRQP